MRIKKLELKNFRGFEDLTIDFPEGESGLAVFVGVNGSGKTSVLDSAAQLLNEYCLRLTKPYRDEQKLSDISPLHKRDIKTGSKEADISASIKMREFDLSIGLNLKQVEVGQMLKVEGKGDFETQENVIVAIRERLENIDWFVAPIIAYYPLQRVASEPDLKVIDLGMIHPMNVYDSSLDASIDFNSFFNWFRSLEDVENELRLNGHESHREKGLESVRTAIVTFMDNVKNPRIKRQPLEEFIVEKDSQTLSFQSLSSGERAIITLVGDIARRLSNVYWKNPLDGDGIVLIDEIEQHLHPAWQRTIIPNLRRTFPNIQFILTTHSPQVLSNVPRENVFLLKDFKLEKHKPHTEGRDSNSILEDIFEVPSRPEEEKGELDSLFDAIEKGDKEKAQKLYDELKRKLGDRDLELQRAENYMELLID